MNTKTDRTVSLTIGKVTLLLPGPIKQIDRRIYDAAMQSYLANPNCPDVMGGSNYSEGERIIFLSILELLIRINNPKGLKVCDSSPVVFNDGRWS